MLQDGYYIDGYTDVVKVSLVLYNQAEPTPSSRQRGFKR